MKYKSPPGRGLLTSKSIEERKSYLRDLGHELSQIQKSNVSYELLKNKIESYVGSTEIPLGLAGPLLFNFEGKHENIHALIATLEGALVASVNRGAKLISVNGGAHTSFEYQKMGRAPLFLFKSEEDRDTFQTWICDNFNQIKKVAESYSNHATLLELIPLKSENALHVKFIYETGDASGQNMTTTCTWHSVLWISDIFESETGIQISDYVIEGNASSDKKVSEASIHQGRGAKVTASCELSEESINKLLRTTSDKLLNFFNPSRERAKEDGMVGYNINVANVVAGIFLATGQDMGSVHESAIGDLMITRTDIGLKYELTLSNLVIGTIGGGTSLPKQAEALELMDCLGTGKLQRFAQVIAGYALALEISTFGAIVSGQFAKSHEKLSRNKPVDWLVRSEITTEFVNKSLMDKEAAEKITCISISDDHLDNGLLTEIVKRVTNKLIGFIPIQFDSSNNSPGEILIKSKPLDLEVIKGLHNLSATLDIGLADMIRDHMEELEYHNTHLKEPWITEQLGKGCFVFSPKYYGQAMNQEREIYMILMERLDPSAMRLLDSENRCQRC